MTNHSNIRDKSDFFNQCFFKFYITDKKRFGLLSQVFDVLKYEKVQINESLSQLPEDLNDDELEIEVKKDQIKQQKLVDELFDLFDEQALSHFWWPSNQEEQEHWECWNSIPISQRVADPTFETTWDFSSMIDSLMTGEYTLVSCQLVTSDIGMLTFQPCSFPYGSSDAIKALIEAFDCKVIGVSLGFGYSSYEEDMPL